jgi:sugar phosphate isomerase/epimerase
MTELKLAVQEQMIPGDNLIEKFELAVKAGYSALELRGRADFALEKRLDELKAARAAGVVMPTECVEMSHFIGDFDEAKRKDAIANMKSQITAIVQAGGFAAVTPASWGMFSLRLPPHVPPRSPEEDRAVLLEALHELGTHAEREGGRLLLEPLNRYEDHMVNTLAAATSLCDEVGIKALGVVADTYHMNIEEDNYLTSLEAAKPWLGHVQLGDSSRYQPGTGHLDWSAMLSALKTIGYDGYMALECRLRGEPEQAIQEAATFMRSEWNKIQ